MVTVVGNSIFQGKGVQGNSVKPYLKFFFWLYFEINSKISSISNVFNITKRIVKVNQDTGKMFSKLNEIAAHFAKLTKKMG